MKAKTNIQALQQANKESKTISGTIKIIRALWKNGYNKAFSDFGISFADMEYKHIFAMCQKNEGGEVVLDANGKPKREEYDEVIGVNRWTATKLYNIIKQSLNKQPRITPE